MSDKPTNGAPRVCHVCGTRVGEAATKCIVCGADLSTGGAASDSGSTGRRGIFRRLQDSDLGPISIGRPEAEPVSSKPDDAPKKQTGGQPAKPAPTLLDTTRVRPVVREPGDGSTTPNPNVEPARSGSGIAVPMPVLVGGLAVVVILAVLLVVNSFGVAVFEEPTATVTTTPTTTPTFTPLPTSTPPPTATPTPLPPLAHTVAEGETCISIAVLYDVSVQSILELNTFPQSCPLFVGQQVQVPQPTSTPVPTPTSTIPADIQTQQAWPRHVVAPGESLSSIATFFGVDFAYMAEINGKLPPDYAIVVGEELIVPIDVKVPTVGPSPTATPLPPYPAPNLLFPADGAAISSLEQTVTLQWASPVELRENEAWLVEVEDVTASDARRVSDTTVTNRYVVNVDLKPVEASPHVFRWTVVAVRQVGTTDDGEAIYEPAGTTSNARSFTWVGIGAVQPTATPVP